MNLLPSINTVIAMSNGTYTPSKVLISTRKKYKKTFFTKKKKRKIKKEKIKQFVRPNYSTYIKSQKWRTRKNKYFAKYGKQCAVCRTKYRLGVHHISYANLGRELDEDLVVLCWLHHEEYHAENGVKRENTKTHLFIEEKRQEIEFAEIVKNL